MVKWILATVMAMASCWSFADFDVTQCDVIQLPNQMSDMESIFTTSSLWNGLPVTGSYHTIAFANNPDTDIIFPMNSFPGKTDRFAVKVTGRILILEKGLWTFSVCHDAGFICTIVGNGYSDSFMEKEWSPIRDVKTFDIPIAGIYTVKIIHWNGSGAAMLEFAVAKGYHSEFNSSLFHLVGDSSSGIACVDPIALFAVYEANGGTGTMEPQTFEDGKKQKLSKNLFKKDGYVFKGWAKTVERANAETVDYKDEAEIAVDADMTLYAVWANPVLKLTAESADWSSGSITMRCEDSDTSGAAHKYTLEYKNASGVWEEVDNAKNVAANKGQAASGQEVWIAKLTDTTFWSCLGGVPPVEYRVKEINNNRFSETCVTRMKYGIFVAPGSYSPSLLDGEGRHIESLLFMPNYASKFETLAGGRGKFVGKALTGNSATYKGLDDEFKIVAGQIKPGDVCFLYFGTHGGAGKNSTVSSLVLYDHFYSEQELAMHIKSLNAVSEHNLKGNGVAVVGFVHACHSGGIVDNSGDDDGVSGYCVPNAWCVNASLLAENVAWVTATDNSKSIAIGEFFSEFLLEYGWDNGWAGDSSDNALSCSELASYTMRQTNALFDGITFANEYGQAINVSAGVSDAHSILQHIVIGERGNHNGNQAAPSAPEITATGVDEHAIKITCQNIYNADAVAKFRRRGTVVSYEYWNGSIGTLHNGLTSELFDNDVANSSGDFPYYYQIRTYNGAGVGKSNVTYAWRVHTECPTVGFMYDVPGANYGGWQWTSTYGISLKDSGIWSAIGEKINELDTRGHTLLGWFTERGGKGTKISGETIAYSSTTYYGFWTAMPQDWLETHSAIATASGGDIVTAAAMTAANGFRTVGECYELGIDPEDPNDDLKIAGFKMKDGKPEITLNHTKDGSGNSFEDRVKILGKAELSDAEWQEVPPEGNPAHRFFTVDVEMP